MQFYVFPWVTDDIRSAARRRSGRLAAQAAAAVGVKCRHEQSQAGSRNTRDTTTQPDKLTPVVRVRGTGVRSDTAVKIAMERTRDFFGQVQSAYRRWQGKEGRGKHKISWAGEVHFLRIFLPGIFHIERNKKDGWDIILSSNTEMLNTYVASKGRSVANKLIWTEPKRHICMKSVLGFYGGGKWGVWQLICFSIRCSQQFPSSRKVVGCRFDLRSPSTIMFLDLFYFYVYLEFEIQITAFSDLNLKARSVGSETLSPSCRSEICSGI